MQTLIETGLLRTAPVVSNFSNIINTVGLVIKTFISGPN